MQTLEEEKGKENGQAPLNVISAKKTANSEDPLINFQLNNPIPPIKRLLKKLFANEEITIKIPVLTAIAIIAFGIGGASGFLTAVKTQLVSRIPIAQTIFPLQSPSPTIDPWTQTVVFGTISTINGDYFLILEHGEVLSLEAPNNINFENLIGKKVLIRGFLNTEGKQMRAESTGDLFLFSSVLPIPTTAPVVTITPSPSTFPTETPVVEPSPETGINY